MREEDLYNTVAEYLRDSRGMGCFATAQKKGNRELGIADVVGVRHVGGDRSNAFEVIVVEVKATKRSFGKKVGEALGYSLFANRCYLAVPDQFDLIQRQFAAQLGVGLIEISHSNCLEVVSAAPHLPYESQMLGLLKQMRLARCSICGVLTHTKGWRSTSRASIALRRSIPYVLHWTRIGKGKLFVCPDCVRGLGALSTNDERLIQELRARTKTTNRIWKLLEKFRSFIRKLDEEVEERPAKWRLAFALNKPFVIVHPKKDFLRINTKGGDSRGRRYRVPTEKSLAYLKKDVRLAHRRWREKLRKLEIPN